MRAFIPTIRLLTALIGAVAVLTSAAAPAVLAQQAMNLEACIEEALAYYPTVDRAERTYAGSVIQRREAGSALLPSVSLTGAFSRYTTVSPQRSLNPATNQIVEGSATALTSMSYYSGMSVSQRLFDRAVTARYTQARAAEENALSAARLERQQVVLLVHQAYYELLRSERNLEVARSDLEYNQGLLDQVQTLFELGRIARVDVLRQESAVASAEQRLITAENGVATGRAELNYLIGREPTRPVEVVDDLAYTPEAVRLDNALTLAGQAHPGLHQAALGVASAQAGLEATKASRWPTMNASGNYSWRGTSYRDISDAFTRDYTWSVGVSFYLPVFDGLRTRYGIEQAEINLQGARRDREAVELQVSRDVHRAVLDLREAEQVLASAQRAVELAGEAVRLAEERLNLGAGTLLELNASQLDLINASYGSVQALFSLKIARAALDFAMGRLER